jgi:hypothetical protein
VADHRSAVDVVPLEADSVVVDEDSRLMHSAFFSGRLVPHAFVFGSVQGSESLVAVVCIITYTKTHPRQAS